MFRLASHSLTTPALKQPPVHLRGCWTDSCQSCHYQRSFHDDSFIRGPHLITPKSGHVDTREEQLLFQRHSDLSCITSQTTLRCPPLPVHMNRISIFLAHTEEIYTHLVCQSWPIKPVYVLNTVGTLNIPDRHRHRRLITAITASY